MDPPMDTSVQQERSEQKQPVANAKGFWETFDDFADVYVHGVADDADEQLGNILLFTTLFSAINTAFLVFSLPNSTPSPMDEMNSLLRLVVQGVFNETNADAIVPHTPIHRDITVNLLFSASLTCSIVASFLATLAKQWLSSFKKIKGESPAQKRQIMQQKLLGAQFWSFQPILDIFLPTLIQIALFLFIAGLVAFLWTFKMSVAAVNALIALAGIAIFFSTTVLALWDPTCPFQTPWSEKVIPGIFQFIHHIFYSIIQFLTPAGQKLLAWVGLLDSNLPSPKERLVNDIELSPRMLGLFPPPKRLPGFSTYRTSQHTAPIHDPQQRPLPRISARHLVGESLQVEIIIWTFQFAQDIAVLRKAAEGLIEVQDRSALQLCFVHGLSTQLIIRCPTLAGTIAWIGEKGKETWGEVKIWSKPEDVVFFKAYLHLYIAASKPDNELWKPIQDVIGGENFLYDFETDEDYLAVLVKRYLHLPVDHNASDDDIVSILQVIIRRGSILGSVAGTSLAFKAFSLYCNGAFTGQMRRALSSPDEELWDAYFEPELLHLSNAVEALRNVSDLDKASDYLQDEARLKGFCALLSATRPLLQRSLEAHIKPQDKIAKAHTLVRASITLLSKAASNMALSLDATMLTRVSELCSQVLASSLVTKDNRCNGYLWDVVCQPYEHAARFFMRTNLSSPHLFSIIQDSLQFVVTHLKGCHNHGMSRPTRPKEGDGLLQGPVQPTNTSESRPFSAFDVFRVSCDVLHQLKPANPPHSEPAGKFFKTMVEFLELLSEECVRHDHNPFDLTFGTSDPYLYTMARWMDSLGDFDLDDAKQNNAITFISYQRDALTRSNWRYAWDSNIKQQYRAGLSRFKLADHLDTMVEEATLDLEELLMPQITIPEGGITPPPEIPDVETNDG